MRSMTTTRNGFTVEDITFKGARKQSSIDEELGIKDDYIEDEIKAPISLTPEQVKDFYKKKISVANDSNEKRVYSQTIKWIDELLEVKRKLVLLESKEVTEVEVMDAEEEVNK